MKNMNIVNQLRNMVNAHDFDGAESKLQKLDAFELSELIEKLPNDDLLAIVREFDSSKPSVLHALITPEKFGELIRLEGHYDSVRHSNGFISTMVFGEHEDKFLTPADFLRSACASEEGMDRLIKYALPGHLNDDHDGAEERIEIINHFIAHGTFNLESEESDDEFENHDGSWKHCLQILRDELPNECELFEIALSDYKNKMEKDVDQIDTLNANHGDAMIAVFGNNDSAL